jgi:hypothetical protein
LSPRLRGHASGVASAGEGGELGAISAP